MDALKKAELAKRKTQPESASSPAPSTQTDQAAAPSSETGAQADSLQFEHSPAATPSDETASNMVGDPTRLPSLPDRLELLDHEFSSQFPTQPVVSPKRESRSEPAPGSSPVPAALSLQEIEEPFARTVAKATHPAHSPHSRPAESDEREAVQNLFETKQAAPSRKIFAIAVGAATLCALAAIGLYFWSELQPKSGLQAANGMRTGAPAASIATTPLPTPAAPTLSGLVLPNDSAGETSPDASPAKKDEPATELAAPAAVTAASPPGKKLFQVSTTAAASNQGLDRAYAALTRGDSATAKAAYQQVLDGDPKNADALSGLAVIAQRSGNDELAADYYLQMLNADPRNATALAGLVNLQSRMDPAIAETRLKQALAGQPDAAALNFSLGNIYARSKRWADAQQAYFKALSGDPGNPDYLFNLAVSLDQLRQPALAAKYYGQAIAAAESRPAAFDKGKAGERLQQLQSLP